MWYVVAANPGKLRPTGPIWFGEVSGQFRRIKIGDDPTLHDGAWFPDDSPAAQAVRDAARGIRGRFIADDANVVEINPTPKKVAPAIRTDDVVDHVVELSRLALSRGWLHADLAGTGLQGDPGEEGGRGVRSGLTLAELTLTRPPHDWTTLAHRGRPPWESVDWTPPHPAWKPPGWPDAAPPAPPQEPTPANAPRVLEEALEGSRESVSEQAPPAAAPPTPSASVDPNHVWPKPTAKWSDELKATFAEKFPGADPYQIARQLVRDLAATRGTTPPPQAAAYVLKRAGLPGVSVDDIAAFLA